ncbi:MAG: NUDIX hydrolase [Candidatus Eremiobacteraeota bacterium]|nr:NUDIX hydrolase [Candidatus Eremiobacteraeota bacterium]
MVESETVFKGRVFKVRADVVSADGKTNRFDIVEHPMSYTVIARPKPDAVLLIRQYRHAAGAYLWELPAGSADADESPLDGVRRELREETGYSAETVREIFSTYMSPGFCTELMRYFVADGLTSGATQFDEDEDIETQTFDLEAAMAMIRAGEITDAKTVAGLLYFERFLTGGSSA